jgi:hypothetical protein
MLSGFRGSPRTLAVALSAALFLDAGPKTHAIVIASAASNEQLSVGGYPERRDCWHVHYGDVHVGTIARRSGCPIDVDRWEWRGGFYPGMGPGEHRDGTAVDLEHARAEFEAAWLRMPPALTEADFQAWRDERDSTAWKTAMSALAITVVTHDGRQDRRCRDRRFVCFGGCCWSMLTTIQRLDGTVLRGQQFWRRGSGGNKLRAGPFLPLRQCTKAGNRNGGNRARRHEFC